jgi:hypothetical protein
MDGEEERMNLQFTTGIYRHYKGPHYQVLGIARNSETEEPMVVYRPLYGERQLWVRPLSMFTEPVEVSGDVVPRFAFMHEAPPPVDDAAGIWPAG